MSDWIEQLERLTGLHKAGALTDEEFAAQKAKLLAASEQPAVPEAVAPPEAAWEPGIEPAASGGVGKWLMIGVPVVAILAAAAWFGSSLIGGSGPDPQLTAGASAAASDAALASAAPTEEAPTPVALDGTLAFAAANNCQSAQTLEQIYKKLDAAGGLGSGKGMTVTLGAYDSPLQIEAKSRTDADGVEFKDAWLRFPANTTWHGLKLSRLTTSTTIVPDSDGGYSRTINFAEKPDKVKRVLDRLGFGAPTDPDFAELTDEGCGGSMSIVAINGGTALRCSWGC